MPRKPPPGPIHITSPIPSHGYLDSPQSGRGAYGQIGMGSPGSGRSTPRSSVGRNGGRNASGRSRNGAVPLDVSIGFSVSSRGYDREEVYGVLYAFVFHGVLYAFVFRTSCMLCRGNNAGRCLEGGRTRRISGFTVSKAIQTINTLLYILCPLALSP